MKKISFYFFFLLFICSSALSQSDFNEGSKINMPNDWGKNSYEKMYNGGTQEKSRIPDFLMEQYRNAKLTRNESEKARVGNEIQKYLDPAIPPPAGTYEQTKIVSGINQPPFNPDWNPTDITVYTGDVGYTSGFRQMDMKMGDDGWLYLAVNRRNVSGSTGAVTIFRSSNGGLTWGVVVTATNGSAYFGNLTMLVDKRHATLDDSVRITVFYTRSGSSTFNDASVEVLSCRRNGSAAYALNFGAPPSGHKYEYPTACSDGRYYTTATYIHVVAREVSNDGNTQYGLRHYLSTDWGLSYTNVLINTTYNDFYPSAAYCEKGTGNDSIYIAVERRFSTTQSEIRAIITCEWLTTNHYVYYLTSGGTGVEYEKPCITVQQQHANVPRRVLITCTKNNIARYHYSTNGGASWQVDYNLGSTTSLADYTWCNSDSLTAGDGYAIACFVDQNGDSITLRRGNITGSLGAYNYKRNGFASTGLLSPVCAIYKTGSTKYSAFAYAGLGPTNVYANQEHLPVGIVPISSVADKYELSQNYPNPFNPETKIKFTIAKESDNVLLKVFDMLGREVQVLVNQALQQGAYEISFSGTKLNSGVYFYTLQSGDFKEVRKMMLLK